MIKDLIFKIIKYRLILAFFLAFFFLGVVFGYFTFNSLHEHRDQLVLRQEGFKFTNPLLDVEDEEEISSDTYKNFEYDLSKIIHKQVGLDNASLYFRDLNNGPWFGVNERFLFSPASLLKLPVMIYYFNKTQSDKALLDTRIRITESAPFSVIYKPELPVKTGDELSVKDLINRMIIDSDNTATYALLNNADLGDINRTYETFGISLNYKSRENIISVRDYSRFFRILYNSSYLNREFSEQALEILSQSKFKDGLVKGVPADIVVAHKFGEYSSNGQYQFHDCGIVYYPEKPYILCIMTRGNDIQKMIATIAELSKYVYERVSAMQ